MSRKSYKITQESINFIKKWIPSEKLTKLIPFNRDRQFDLLEILSDLEVSLSQSKEAGENVDADSLNQVDSAVDEVNRLDLDLKDLTNRLK